MITSAGALIKAEDTGRFFFVLRSSLTSYPSKWSLCGGKIHSDEHVLDGLTRELSEELGFVPEITKWAAFNSFLSNDEKFSYYSLILLTPKEFMPILNHENDGYAWVNIDNPPFPLHPRLREVITRKIIKESLKNFC
jgi:8-oxo-dGTP pyrophosphatase MutT (NUDIX family)